MPGFIYSFRKRSCQLLKVALALLPGIAWAQTQPLPTGGGIVGEYYDGSNFERLVTRRHDATIAFDWAHQPPAPGMPTEYFSVRWMGWLVPPASGRYLFHITTDDGMRMWLNDKLVLNEWRPQAISYFTIAVELKAGEPYQLRVEYFQDILDTRARITWERPDVPKPSASWRNLWGMRTDEPQPEPIATRFLFSRNPRPAAPRVAAVKPPASPPPKPTPVIAMPMAPARRVLIAPVAKPVRRPVPPLILAPVPTPVVLPAVPNVLRTDSGSAAQLVQMAAGETVTLPELRFEQGRARLLPAARIALDGLALTLQTRPELRFEVQGHTDNVGNAELNRQLSQQRAEAVCLYLTAHGVATAQLRPVGFGGTHPVADNADPAQRPRNRRVVLRRL